MFGWIKRRFTKSDGLTAKEKVAMARAEQAEMDVTVCIDGGAEETFIHLQMSESGDGFVYEGRAITTSAKTRLLTKYQNWLDDVAALGFADGTVWYAPHRIREIHQGEVRDVSAA